MSDRPSPSRGSTGEVIDPFHWDARWNAEDRDLAVQVAQRALRDAGRRLDEAARDIERYAAWLGTAHMFKAAADAKEAGGDV